METSTIPAIGTIWVEVVEKRGYRRALPSPSSD
jgi:hypothetical protein